MFRCIPTQRFERIISRCYRYCTSAVRVRAGNVTWGITNDKRLLRRDSVPQEGVRPLLCNRYQVVTIMMVATIGSELKIMPRYQTIQA